MTLFDSIGFVAKLMASGYSREQAEALAKALAEVATTELATKADIEKLKTQIDAADKTVDLKLTALEQKLGSKIRETFNVQITITMLTGLVIILSNMLK